VGVMNAIALVLSVQDSADVAAFFAAQAGGLPALSGERSRHHSDDEARR
jgi:cytochrome c553